MNFRHLTLATALVACIGSAAPPLAVAGAAAKTPQAMYDEADAAFDRKECDKAFPLFKKAAAAGHALAMIKVGVCHDMGCGTKKDNKAPVQWYAKAAATGSPHGMYALGAVYRFGDGAPKDSARAFKLFFDAANLELGASCLVVADMYLAGEGTKADIGQAALYYTLAVGGGEAEAKPKLMALRPKMTKAQIDKLQLDIQDWIKKYKKL